MVIEHRVSRANTFFDGKQRRNKIWRKYGNRKENEMQQNNTKTMHRPCFLFFLLFEKKSLVNSNNTTEK